MADRSYASELRDPETIKARWQPIVGLKAFLTGTTADLGAAITFTRDGKPLAISPADLLQIMTFAAADIFALLDEIAIKNSLLLAHGISAEALGLAPAPPEPES